MISPVLSNLQGTVAKGNMMLLSAPKEGGKLRKNTCISNNTGKKKDFRIQGLLQHVEVKLHKLHKKLERNLFIEDETKSKYK